jgi:hypothetical protein
MVLLVDILSKGAREVWLLDERCESGKARGIITL